MHRLATSMVLALGMLAIFGAMTLSHADERRERAEALKQEAKSLAEQGFREEAEALRAEAKKLFEAAARDDREPRRAGRPERPVPLRLGEEVQEVLRPPRLGRRFLAGLCAAYHPSVRSCAFKRVQP